MNDLKSSGLSLNEVFNIIESRNYLLTLLLFVFLPPPNRNYPRVYILETEAKEDVIKEEEKDQTEK